jgi:hypothetical protein
MRALVGIGTPRGLQGRATALIARLLPLWTLIVSLWRDPGARATNPAALVHPFRGFTLLPVNWSQRALSAPGC